MKDISIEELKTIQLDVLQAIDNFCLKEGIVYSLACGTALGAIRHKGYIPWDDDIDIYLLREDYNTLMKTYPNNGRYRLISLETNKEWDRPYARAYDSETVLEERCNCSKIIGVGIDVYPIDSVPEKEEDWIRFDKKRRNLQKFLQIKQMQYNNERPLYKNLALFFGKAALCFVSRKRMVLYINSFIQAYNKQESEWVFESAQGMIQKNRFHKRVFERTIPVPFEDREFMIFEDYDEYLHNGYGNYMQLPPKEKQVAHHSFNAYWK